MFKNFISSIHVSALAEDILLVLGIRIKQAHESNNNSLDAAKLGLLYEILSHARKSFVYLGLVFRSKDDFPPFKNMRPIETVYNKIRTKDDENAYQIATSYLNIGRKTYLILEGEEFRWIFEGELLTMTDMLHLTIGEA